MTIMPPTRIAVPLAALSVSASASLNVFQLLHHHPLANYGEVRQDFDENRKKNGEICRAYVLQA